MDDTTVSRQKTAMKSRLAAALLAAGTATAAPSYLIVSTPATAADPAWQQVVEALRTKHSAPVFTCGNDIDSALPELQRLRPEFTCFVMPPAQASREMVQKIHRLTRRIDADPYTDTRWGILTGFDAANALEIALESAPLTIRRVGSGTELAMDRIASGTWYCELRKGHMVSQQAGSLPVRVSLVR